MNWKREAENDLRNYKYARESIENIKERIRITELKMTSIKSATADSTPVMGGGNRYEDMMLDSITEKERLLILLRERKKHCDLIEKGLAALNEREAIAVQRFLIDGIGYAAAVDRLRDELHCEEAQLNRIRNAALYHFTLAMFGITEN